jgi:hypothetical protein
MVLRAQTEAATMQQDTMPERFIGVDFHKVNTVVTRLHRDGSRAGKTETYPSTRPVALVV